MRPVVPFLARGLVLLVAALLAVTAAGRSAAPLPDLVLPLVVAGALRCGPSRGALLGLGAGWLVDLMPPGPPVLGTSALLYAACGLLAGAGRREGETPWGWLALVAAGAGLLATAARLVLAVVAGAPVDPARLGLGCAATVLWCVVAVPVLVGFEQRLVRWARS